MYINSEIATSDIASKLMEAAKNCSSLAFRTGLSLLMVTVGSDGVFAEAINRRMLPVDPPVDSLKEISLHGYDALSATPDWAIFSQSESDSVVALVQPQQSTYSDTLTDLEFPPHRAQLPALEDDDDDYVSVIMEIDEIGILIDKPSGGATYDTVDDLRDAGFSITEEAEGVLDDPERRFKEFHFSTGEGRIFALLATIDPTLDGEEKRIVCGRFVQIQQS